MTRDLPILGTVTPGRERYCPILAAQVDQMWPGHGALYYALPADRTAPYERVIQTGESTWTGTLLAGLKYVRDVLGARYTFVLLEDHVPLYACDVRTIDRVLEIMQTDDLRCVFFTKYDWPWTSIDTREDEHGRIIGWRAIDVVTIGGKQFARMPKDFFRYNQCQPAIWHVGYYIEVVEEAIRRGITDPWMFESYIMPGQAQHYVSAYKWPSWSNGYFDKRQIDWRAIRLMQMPESRLLRDALLKERYAGVPLSADALYLLGECQRYANEAARLPGRLVRRIGRALRGAR